MPLDPQTAKAAADNLNQVAEAQLRLAAAGQVNLASLGQNIQAFQFLRQEIDRMTKAVKEEQKTAQAFSKVFNEFNKATLSAVQGVEKSVAQMQKFIHAANPQLFGAFQTQLELLQAKIGNELIPLFSQLMSGVDDVIEWFDGLTDGQKKLVAGMAVAIPTMIGLTRAALGVAPAVKAAAAALEELRTKAAAHPYIAGAMTGVGVVGGFVSLAYSMQAFEEREHERLQQGIDREGSPKEKEVDAAKFTDEERRLLESHRREDRERGEELVRQRNEREKGKNSEWLFFESWDSWIQRANKNEVAQRQEARESIAGRAVESPLENSEEAKLRKQEAHIKRQIEAAKRAGGLQPHYSGLADIHKQLQVSMLDKTNYQKDLLETQRKGLPKLLKKLDEIHIAMRRLGMLH